MREIILPNKRRDPIHHNPRFMIIYGKPKSGKSHISSMLEDNLIVDFDHGTDFISAMTVEIYNMEELKSLIKQLKQRKTQYNFITLDTATKLEEVVLEYALELYKATPIGKRYGGKNILELPQGSGYYWLRIAYKKIIEVFMGLTPHLILIGHLRDALINQDGEEITENSIALSGQLRSIIPAEADAVGLMTRHKNKNILSFKGGQNFIAEARAHHLRGQEIVIGESDENGEITTYWNKIFI